MWHTSYYHYGLRQTDKSRSHFMVFSPYMFSVKFWKEKPFLRSIVDIFARLVSHFPYAGRNTTIKTFFPQLLLIPPLSIYKRPCNEQVADTNDNLCTCRPLNLRSDFNFSCYKANSGSRERGRIKQPRLLFNCAFGKANQRIRVNQERSESR